MSDNKDDALKNKKTNSKIDESKGDSIYEEEIEVIIDEEKAKEEQSRKKYSTKLADSGSCIFGDINRGAKA
jgi:hypothetical protein